jgi:multidrug resistance protein, MATE family
MKFSTTSIFSNLPSHCPQFGMGSALDTLCGQAVGAGHLDMLGIYTQQSWLVCGATALALTPAYAFTTPILRSLLRQPTDVAAAAGPYARWAIPRLFAHAMNYPLLKFFQTQSKVWVVAAISGVSLAVHVVLTYAAVRRLRCGLRGAAVAGNISHWLIVLSQLLYMVGGRFLDAWKRFSFRAALKNIGAFVKLSLVSALMIWLVYMILISFLFLRSLLIV